MSAAIWMLEAMMGEQLRTRGKVLKRATKPVVQSEAEDDPFDAPVGVEIPSAAADAMSEADRRGLIDHSPRTGRKMSTEPGDAVLDSLPDSPTVVHVDYAVGNLPTKLEAPPAEPSRKVTLPGGGVQKIIESVFTIDLDATWNRIHEVLRATEGPQYGAGPRKALAVVDDRTREAHKLYCNLKLELERYKGDVEATQAGMREEATEELQAEKDSGSRNKAITESDIRARMLANHPDEFQHNEVALRKFKLAVEHAEKMVDILKQKSWSLQSEVGRGVTSGKDD